MDTDWLHCLHSLCCLHKCTLEDKVDLEASLLLYQEHMHDQQGMVNIGKQLLTRCCVYRSLQGMAKWLGMQCR